MCEEGGERKTSLRKRSDSSVVLMGKGERCSGLGYFTSRDGYRVNTVISSG